jgi:hypothetical protein
VSTAPKGEIKQKMGLGSTNDTKNPENSEHPLSGSEEKRPALME